MRFTVLALDYDGTITRDGVLDPEMRGAIADARERGITLVIVTSRILDDLRRVAGDLRFVDAVVVENGAVVAFPEGDHSVALATSPPQLLSTTSGSLECRSTSGSRSLKPMPDSPRSSLEPFGSSCPMCSCSIAAD
jgi:hypothetical protein